MSGVRARPERPVHRELVCPSCDGAIVLRADLCVCTRCAEAFGIEQLARSGRTRDRMFVAGRYPKEEPWRRAG